MITIAERIEVPSPPEVVWEVLADPEAVVSCIGGAELGATHPDGSFDAALTVKFGGLRVGFTARASLTLDNEQMEGQFAARGEDRQGATRVSSDVRLRVRSAEQGTGSVLTMDGEVKLSGKLASVIDAGAGVVVTRMTREFASALSARCVSGQAADGVGADHHQTPANVAANVHGGDQRVFSRLRAWFGKVLRLAGRAERTTGLPHEQPGSPPNLGRR